MLKPWLTDASIRFIQEKELTPKKVSGRPLFGGKGSPGLIGVDVELEFDSRTGHLRCRSSRGAQAG